MTELPDITQRNDDNEVVAYGGDDKNPSKFNMSKNEKPGIQMYIEAMGKPTFPIPSAKEAFN